MGEWFVVGKVKPFEPFDICQSVFFHLKVCHLENMDRLKVEESIKMTEFCYKNGESVVSTLRASQACYLTTLGFFLWGYANDRVYAKNPQKPKLWSRYCRKCAEKSLKNTSEGSRPISGPCRIFQWRVSRIWARFNIIIIIFNNHSKRKFSTYEIMWFLCLWIQQNNGKTQLQS